MIVNNYVVLGDRVREGELIKQQVALSGTLNYHWSPEQRGMYHLGDGK